MLSYISRPGINTPQMLTQIWRSVSTTIQLRNIKMLSLNELTAPNMKSDDITDARLVESIAAEWKQAKLFKAIPGPTRFQLMRGFMSGGEFDGISLNDLLLRCRQRYGDICLIPGPFGQPPMLSLFDPRDFEQVHRTEGKYPVRPGSEAIIYYRQKRKDGFFKETLGLSEIGKGWADFRSKINPVLMKSQNACRYLEPMKSVSADFIQRIREVRDPKTFEVPENFYTDIIHLTFESVAVVALDKKFGLIRSNDVQQETQKLFECLHIYLDSVYELGVKPSFYKYFRTATYRRFEEATDYVFDLTKKYVDEAQERFERQESGVKEVKSVLEELLTIDRKVAIIIAMDMLHSGVETTSPVIAGALLLLAKHPEKQAKLREEILHALSQEKHGEFTVENMRNLPYLRACLKEALRIYPLLSGNFRATGMDIVLGGYRVPKGTRVLMNSNLLLSEERYFPHAKEFIPERWLRTDSKRLSSENISPFIFLPFGFGPKTCIGKRIVNLELELTLANLVRNFMIGFNYSTENAFKCKFMSTPAIPLKFKFTDL